MRFSTIAASAALAAGVSATGNSTGDVYVTQVVSQYTTFCPASTTLTHEGKTYTITKATTIVLPCAGGCTITKPVVSVPASVPASAPAPGKSAPAPEKSVPAPAPGKPTYAPAPVPAPSAGAPAPPSNGTAPTYKAPSGTAAAAPSAFTGAANQAFAASGAGLAAVFGLAAYLL